MDFSEYRPYQPGDDLRSLDWKVYGRTDRLYTKLYVPEQEETVYFLLDTSLSMHPKWPALKTIVMGLANVVLGQGDRVGIYPLLNPDLLDKSGVSPMRGRSALARISTFLQGVNCAGVTDLDQAFTESSRRIKKRSHLIVVSDFLQEGAGLEGLSKLRYRRHRMSLIQLLSPSELDPKSKLSPGEWELFDPEYDQESGPSLRIDIGSGSFKLYSQALQEHIEELKLFGQRAGAIFIQTSTEFQPLSFFSEDLRKAGLLT